MDTITPQVNIPEIIKQKIRKNIGIFKQILEDDKEFADYIMFIICNPGRYLAIDVINSVYERYPDIIKKCQEEYKPFPLEITKLRKIISSLFHLACGDDELIMNEVKDYDFATAQLERKALADLCIKEINFRFNPEVNYIIHPFIMEDYNVECTGEDSDPEAI
jgi:hypothetical protein